MTEVTLDKTTLAKLHNLQVNLEVRDEAGQLLGTSCQPKTKATYAIVEPQVSEAELDRREAEEVGRPLPEIMRDLSQMP